MVQFKSARGVQQEDVWAAADALIGEGLRPTIERVRLKMGRGSPNTVSPLLDAWFSTLGSRLAAGSETPSAASDLPVAVRQVASQLWEAALQDATLAADQRLGALQQVMAVEAASIAQREIDLIQREQRLLERQNAQDELLQLARAHAADLSTQLEQSAKGVVRREAEIEALQQKLTHLDAQRAADQRNSMAQLSLHAQERGKLEEHASLTERRLMTELDRERQESKRLKSGLEKSELRLETVSSQFQEQLQKQAQTQQASEQELRLERQAGLIAQKRVDELRASLDVQVKETATVLGQLSQLMLTESAKEPRVEKLGRRVRLKAAQARSS